MSLVDSVDSRAPECFSARMFTQPLVRRVLRRGVAAVDSLAAPHGIDRYVEQVILTWSSHEVRGEVVAVDRSAAGTVLLTIEANGNWTGFRAGQHTQLSVEIDGVRHTRCYSMCSAAGTHRRFQLGIKAHPEGLVSRHLVAHARPGLVVGLTPATGEFHLPDVRPDRILLISGGSGITPVLAMLRTLCAEGYDAPVAFLHYDALPHTVLDRAEIEALAGRHPNVRLLWAYDQRPEAGPLQGLLDDGHLAAADARWAEAETYVCGPVPLMDAVAERFAAAGAADRVHREAFTLPAFLAEAGEVGGTVRFAAAQRDVAADGSPLLDLAEAAGLAPAHGCRMGICRTCTCSLTSGTVRDVVTGQLTTAAPADGGTPVRICVSVPVGDVELDL